MANEKNTIGVYFGVLALFAIILVVSIIGYFASRPKPAIVQGEVEATEYRVSGKVPGRIERFLVKEGDMVQMGDTVVVIDSPEVRAKLAQAHGAVDAAKAQMTKAENGARKEEIAALNEIWQKAKVGEEIMKKSFDRVKNLYDKGVVTAQKYDETEAQYKAAVATAKAAKSQYDMAVKGARYEDKEAARALADRASGALQEVESYLGELVLTSPVSGVVTARFPKVGELVGTGAPIMTITDLTDMWLTFSIREDMLAGMKVGDEITIKVPALGKEVYKAKVTFMNVMASYATWRATQETGQYDAKTFEFKAVPVEPIEGLYPGMTIVVVR